MHRMLRVLVFLMAATVFAEEVAAPELSDAQRAKYWRALSSVSAAKVALEEANKGLNEVLIEMSGTCKGQVYQDQKGEPTCKVSKSAPQ